MIEMFLIAILGIPLGFIAAKFYNIYLYILLFFGAFYVAILKESFRNLFNSYSYWIFLPIVIHFVLMWLTMKRIEKNKN